MSGTRTETRLSSSLARSLSARHGGFAHRLTVHVLPYMYYVPYFLGKVCSFFVADVFKGASVVRRHQTFFLIRQD